jgi:nitrite reductase/ring-hydroxylating ferredoxin subunit
MNKVPNYFDIIRGETTDDDETKEQYTTNTKRGVFRRIRDRISRTFTDKNNNDKTETSTHAEPGYRPSPIDSLRLKLALAMSNISSPFQRSREEWVVACPKTRVGPGQIVPCVVNGLDIIIFASRDGKRLDAFANSCPHLGSPFDLATIERKPVEEGRLIEDDGAGDGCVDCIVCPVHRTAFEIQSGDVRGEWCPYPPVLGGIM